MRRRELLIAGLALGVLPLRETSLGEQSGPEAVVSAAQLEREVCAEVLKCHAALADYSCEQGLDQQLNWPGDALGWESLGHFMQAARSGQPFGQWMLSTRYREGWRAPLRRGQALELCHQVAQGGELMAQMELALRYRYGCGVPKNEELSERMWNDVNAKGIPMAKTELALLEPNNRGSWRPYWEAYSGAGYWLMHTMQSSHAEPCWYSSPAGWPIEEVARLKLRLLRAKRLGRPVWRLPAAVNLRGSRMRPPVGRSGDHARAQPCVPRDTEGRSG